MRLSPHNIVPVEYALDDDRWPKARAFFIKAVGPYTTVALVVPINVCDSSGVAHVLEHLLFRGSVRYPDRNLLLETRRNLSCLDINAGSYEDHLVLHITSASTDDLTQVFDAYFDAIQQPSLEQKHFEQELEIVLNEIKAIPEIPMLDERINVGGEPQLLQQLTHRSMQSFWRHQCHPDEFIIIVVGEEPMAFSTPLPEFAHTVSAPVYVPLKAELRASKGNSLSLGTLKYISKQLDAAMLQSIAGSLGWVRIEGLAEFTLWHSAHAVLDTLRKQIIKADDNFQFERSLQHITQQALYPGAAKHHANVQIATTLAAAVIRSADLETVFAQHVDTEACLTRWRDQAWREKFAQEFGSKNTKQKIVKNAVKPQPIARRLAEPSRNTSVPTPTGEWLTINGASVWVHEGEEVHWTLRYDGLQACKYLMNNRSSLEALNLSYFNPIEQAVAQSTTSGEFTSSNTFLNALQSALNSDETMVRLKILSPAFTAVLNRGNPFQARGQGFSYPQRPRLQHLSIPERFLQAFEKSGIVDEGGNSEPRYERVYRAVDKSEHQSGGAAILIPIKSIPDVQQETSLHLFAAFLELKFIMPHLRELCGAYGGSARYLPHLKALVLQSYGDPKPQQSGDLLWRWFNELSAETPVGKDINAAKNQACSLLQLRGKSSLWYQFGEVVTTSRWQQTQAVWQALLNKNKIDISDLI